jgi:hypothetical protein
MVADEAELPPERLAAARPVAAATSFEDLITQALEPVAQRRPVLFESWRPEECVPARRLARHLVRPTRRRRAPGHPMTRSSSCDRLQARASKCSFCRDFATQTTGRDWAAEAPQLDPSKPSQMLEVLRLRFAP